MEEEYAYADNQPYVKMVLPEYHPAPYMRINPKVCEADYIIICYGRLNECRIRRYLKKIGKLDKTVINRLNKKEWKMCTSPLFDYKIEVVDVRVLEHSYNEPDKYHTIEYFDPVDLYVTALMYTKFKYFKWLLLHDLDVVLGDVKEDEDETSFIDAIKETMKTNLSEDIAKAIIEGDGRFKPEDKNEQTAKEEIKETN